MARKPIPRALRGTRGPAVAAPKRAPAPDPHKPAPKSTVTSRPAPRPAAEAARPRPEPTRTRSTRSSSRGHRRRRRATNRWLPFQTVSGLTLVVLALIVVLLAAVAGGLAFWQGYDAGTLAARKSAVSAAAVQAQTLFSYDYRHVEQDVAASRKVVTGKLATDFATTSSKVVIPQAKANKAVVQASVSASSVMDATPDRVVVLLYLNQAVQNKNIQGQRLDQARVRLTMQKVDGNWLIAEATPL
ncbi:hypothetical protein [Fodinicola acaciae]|uniref:hypothetical protein n=1 Tax=Fodinicola acaciae TaxID=2681555 RepID=UPI0013D8A670|nr:hypothetical protein [Fodinicola acaciae]